MYLKTLTLRGFKSFASTTTLHFEPGITCVVGPNGSGKSNVVDALSWVMGEQGAKSLRGGKMEDVIFAGTSGRAPLGRAEVQLTIDNTDGALPIDYTEVTIARTMFRNGGSEYAINGNPARLLDVQDLLSDSGIGREMHVIVGQGQLDSILNATPETRRGFIEEAAGVLKHRKRKEKAERKLEATSANLNRLSDLLGEIRRQLKPLGRQAEVARRAAVIQAEVRDARARLLADDYVAAATALAGDQQAEAELEARRARLEDELDRARQAEQQADQASRDALPELTAAQENWYALAGLVERVNATSAIAAERLRSAESVTTDERPGRDPEAIEREAASIRQAEESLGVEVAALAQALETATTARQTAERSAQESERLYRAQVRAISDRREGLARLTGEVNTLNGRAESAAAEIERLQLAREQVEARSEAAKLGFAALETRIAELAAGEVGLDAAWEQASTQVEESRHRAEESRIALAAAQATRAGLTARVEALRLGLERKDATGALLAAGPRLEGLLGSVATLITVADGAEVAVAAALGVAADAIAVTGLDSAVGAFEHLKEADLGRAGLLLGGPLGAGQQESWPELPATATWARDLVTCEDRLRGAVDRLLVKVAVVSDLDAARRLVDELPDVTAVTAEGDLLSTWFAVGGSGSAPSLIEVRAALDDAEEKLVAAQAEAERLRFAIAEQESALTSAQHTADAAMARLNESDASHAGLAEEAAELGAVVRSSHSEATRLDAAITAAQEIRDRTAQALSGLVERLRTAQDLAEIAEADPTDRDRWVDASRAAIAAEMEARLALRTQEERARAFAGRADSLLRAAEAERQARERARARAELARKEADVARSVLTASLWLVQQVRSSLEEAERARREAQSRRTEAEQALAAARSSSRELAKAFEELVHLAHRDELALAQRQMKVDALAEKALSELGLEPEALVEGYGPDQPVEILVAEDGGLVGPDEERLEPVRFVRADQEKRLRRAERDLAVLGKVNPLALEEFDALQQRHSFLAEQLEDLRRTRADLAGIIDEVDGRVQQVFAEAYADVERAFADSFARLFPGGEGRLLLTEPGQWLTTGVDVEARPAGKKVKRLSLLSGGERSLVAVAFLVALFKARPSPFYILDEVEAALDDTNLGRLLEIYEELRDNSQLLVITHQKRTMEIADALYGVTMRGDGVTTVISQRLREQ